MKNFNKIFLMLLCSSAHASSPLFSITETGTINITLCLNATAQLSCQTFNVSTLALSIKTTIPNHTYSNVGIRINTPGYTIAPGTSCTPLASGYCQFSTSNTAAASISIDNGQPALNQFLYVPSIPDPSHGYVEQCTLETNGSFTTYAATPTVEPSWFPSGIAFATANNVTRAYVSSAGITLGVFKCNLSTQENGTLSDCTRTVAPSDDNNPPVWYVPRGIAFATSTNQYAYIPMGVLGSGNILKCELNASDGSLNSCVNASSESTGAGFPSSIAFKTTTSGTPTQYAYITDANNGSVYFCPVHSTDGTLVGEDCNETGNIPIDYDDAIHTNGIAFATFNANTYAYITDQHTNTVYQCAWNASTGELSTCVNAKDGDPIAWNLTGIAFGTVNGVQYAYVSDFNNSDNYSGGTIWQCHVDTTTGHFTSCDKTPTTSPNPAWTVGGSVAIYPAAT